MKKNSGEIILAILAGVAVITAGLSAITASHNSRLAMEVRDGKVYAGVRSSFGPGVVGAVSESPGATLATVAAGIATAYVVNQSGSKGDSQPAVQVTGNGNNVNYNGGKGQQNTTTDNSTKSGPE